VTGTEVLRHIRVDLALHTLRGGDGRPLLLLHGLGEHTPAEVPSVASAWPGPIMGLDFTGHGASTIPVGGGYTSEVLMADVDAVLAHIGEATILGRGLGAYVALLIAGARPTLVTGAVLTDGPGLAGGGPAPHSPSIVVPAVGPETPSVPDPYALAELARDIRPPDYAATFARQALEFSGLETPLTVAAVVRPPWLAEVLDFPGVAEAPSVPAALARYATLTRPPQTNLM
jgi:pimeloyl-ACP methyl ester carboxylesterase